MSDGEMLLEGTELIEGGALGCEVGETLIDGVKLGFPVGLEVGTLLGNPVGLIVGTLLTVGLNVGELVEGKEVRELPPPHEQHASLAVYPKFE